jgi:hypothetical protein
MDHPKIDNATKMFFHDFMVRSRFDSGALGPDVIEDKCGEASFCNTEISRSLQGSNLLRCSVAVVYRET